MPSGDQPTAERPGPTAWQRGLIATVCFAAMVLMAAEKWLLGGVVFVTTMGAFYLVGWLGPDPFIRRVDGPPVESEVVAAARGRRLPLWLSAIVAGPIVAVAGVITIGLAGGADAGELPLELVVPASAFAALWAGIEAVRAGARSEAHGWWALAGGLTAVVVFGLTVAILA